jgi:hypothetical protein
VNLNKNIVHKSSYFSGYVKKAVLKRWLGYLTAQPLYRCYKIEVHLNNLSANVSAGDHSGREEVSDADNMEFMNVDGVQTSEIVQARHAMLWNEDHCLNIAAGQHPHPLNGLYDLHVEELSFPAIYYGVARQFKPSITVTPFMMCNSEIWRSDRRGVPVTFSTWR